MLKLISAIRTQGLFWPLTGLFIFGCASGPVTTQIDKNKNPVVKMPIEFQSPLQAIDDLVEPQETSSPKDSHVRKVRNRILKTLLGQQKEIADELNETSKILLKPGVSYEFNLEAFCVNAGVERPFTGDGLFLGDIEGAAKAWLPLILQSYKKKGASQEEAQILIWSLLSGTRFDQLNSKSQSLLLKFFPDAHVRFGHSVIEDQAKSLLMSQLPTEILSAKNEYDVYQDILQNSRKQFAEIEKTLSPISSRVNALEVGWLKHEDGYYIHLQADGYKKVRVKIYAPKGLNAGTYFKPTQHVVLPSEGQRLALSAIVIERIQDGTKQVVKNVTSVSANEAEFILQNPSDAVKIYNAARKAIHETSKNFRFAKDFEDNSADAFRHFVWSGIVAREVGTEKATAFLKAHEDYPENKPAAKSMDLFNNLQGIDYSEKYRGQNFERDLIQAGLDKIGSRELRWIK